MMSNGPRSSRLFTGSVYRSKRAPFTSSSLLKTWTRRNPSSSNRPSERWRSSACRRVTCGPNGRSTGRFWLRSWQNSALKLNTTATGCAWYLRAISKNVLRLSARTLVASITVSRPAASRFAHTRCSSSNASSDAAWFISSSLTIPRKKSDDRISVALKCARANVDLPHPDGPIISTRANSGM